MDRFVLKAGVKLGITIAVLWVSTVFGQTTQHYGTPPDDVAGRIEILVKAYPDFIVGREGNWLIMKGGKRLPISDGKTNKTFDELIEIAGYRRHVLRHIPERFRAKAASKKLRPGPS